MTPVLRAAGLGRRYRRRWALRDCSLEIEAGHVTGLVGPNGAGKSTLLDLAAGMRSPTTGSIEVCGHRPASSAEALAQVGYVAQDHPTWGHLSVDDHLRFGAHTNPAWDEAFARRRIEELGLDPSQRAGRLSGGCRAQLALIVGLAKRPSLLLLDEPVASLDPLARRAFLQVLLDVVAEGRTSVVLSSHLVSDLERTCDHVVVLVDSRVGLEGEVDDLLATHHRLTGPVGPEPALPAGAEVLAEQRTERQVTLVVRSSGPVLDPAWTVSGLGLEDIVLAHLDRPDPAPAPTPRLAVVP